MDGYLHSYSPSWRHHDGGAHCDVSLMTSLRSSTLDIAVGHDPHTHGRTLGFVLRTFGNAMHVWECAASMCQMLEIASMIRRAVTTPLIRLGADNRFVLALINQRCRRLGTSLTNEGSYLSLRKGRQEIRLAKKHLVYAPTLAERFALYFNDLKPTEINGTLVLDYSEPGTLQTYLQSGLQFQMASFPEEVEAINDYLHWYTPKAGDTIFDVGAHCGVSTYHFAKMVGPLGRVIAFEPDPVNFSLLLSNIERHAMANVTALQIAIAGTSGEAAFNSESSIGSGLSRQATRVSVGKTIMVKAITLEEAFCRWGPSQFCKIDIEGSEIEVVAASRGFLSSDRIDCQFALDTNHEVGGSLTDTRIEELFRRIGYEAKTSQTGLKTTWARR